MSGKSSIDQELERLLAGEETELSALYRNLPAAEPDEKLDAAVLAMAHRAINPHLAATSRVDRRAPARPKPWMFALGSAAGVVLAAGIAWQLRSTIQQNGEESLQRATAPATEGMIAVTPKERASRPEEAPPAPATLPAAPAPAPAPAKPMTSAAPKAASAPPLGDDAARSKLEQESLQKRADEKQKSLSTDEEALSAARNRREEHGVTEYTLPAGAAGPAPRPAPFPAEPAAQANAPSTKMEDRARAQPQQGEKLETISVSGSRIRAADVDTASPVATPPEQDSVERKAAIASGGSSHAQPPAPAPEPKDAAAAEAFREAPATTAPSRSTLLQNNARLAPGAWIGVMRQLLRDGRREEARENLDLFRRKHPDYKLPPDLKALIDSP
jgi:hypothetical protein